MNSKVLKFFPGILFIVLIVAPLSRSAVGAGNYTITPMEEQSLATGAECGWILSYGEEGIPVQICMHESKNTKTYVVRTTYFEVAYVSGKNGFGTSNLKSSYSAIPKELTDKVVNSAELKKQRVILANQVDDETAVSLIADYLPDLINSEYQPLLD